MLSLINDNECSQTFCHGTCARKPSLGEAQGRWARTLARAASRESLWALQEDRERNGQRFIWKALLWRGTKKRSNGRDAKKFENCSNEVDLCT